MKGKAAKVGRATQDKVVKTKACLIFRFLLSALVVNTNETPTNRVKPDDKANTCQSGFITAASTTAGSNMAMASVVSKIPRTKNIGRKSSKWP